MRVIVNARYAGRRITGVERYATEITAALEPRVETIYPAHNLQQWRGHCWEQFVLPARVPPDGILWSPANSGPACLERQVVTIHDLSPILHPEWFRPTYVWWYRWLLPALARRARFVLTPSTFSKSQVRWLGIPADRVRVITPGVSTRFCPAPPEEQAAVRSKYHLPRRYLLFVGSHGPQKNLTRLIEAWEAISHQFPGVGLVLAGSPPPSSVPFGGLVLSPSVQVIGYTPERELPALYSAAEAFVLVSEAEGFGLTVLEAMACGAPMVLAKAGALPEAAGQAAIYVNPQDPDQIADGLTRALEDGDLRAELSRAGRNRAEGFRWETSAEFVWQACEDAASG